MEWVKVTSCGAQMELEKKANQMMNLKSEEQHQVSGVDNRDDRELDAMRYCVMVKMHKYILRAGDEVKWDRTRLGMCQHGWLWRQSVLAMSDTQMEPEKKANQMMNLKSTANQQRQGYQCCEELRQQASRIQRSGLERWISGGVKPWLHRGLNPI
ncbi:hypothetical protein JB92DRAFT_2833508 [Gautieria morchelliformis]|nr:hypothetical protein JB92DRAFT_2833508 [Gautieria morchelliformis]